MIQASSTGKTRNWLGARKQLYRWCGSGYISNQVKTPEWQGYQGVRQGPLNLEVMSGQWLDYIVLYPSC
jgi:hypothetical protein